MIPFVLRYGAESTLRLEIPADVVLAECGRPQGDPLPDVSAAVVQALANPLDYPALAQSATPGDRVVLTVDHGVPQMPTIVASVVRTLADCGVGLDGLTVLQTKTDVESGRPGPLSELPESMRERIALAVHDPEDRTAMAYLAASEEGEPILLNRAITDADVVLPVGCLSARRAGEYHGIHGAVYPAFSDQRTLLRFHSPDVLGGHGAAKKRLVKECDEVGWLLGVNLTLQIVPGSGDSILHVLAGQSDRVRQRGRDLYQAAWGCSVPRRASLVVAAVEGVVQQTWQNIGQAVASSAALVEDGGAIAICCDLATHPGPAIQQLAGAPSTDQVLRTIRRERAEDAIAATQLAHALERVHIYLLSRLDASLVEDLNMAPLSEPEDVARLVHHYPSCILLSNAPHAVAKLAAAP